MENTILEEVNARVDELFPAEKYSDLERIIARRAFINGYLMRDTYGRAV